MPNAMTTSQVFDAILSELDRQDKKWGANKPQSLPGFMLIIQKELDEATTAWVKNIEGDHAPLNELVQVAAVAVACLRRYGINGSAIATDDMSIT